MNDDLVLVSNSLVQIHIVEDRLHHFQHAAELTKRNQDQPRLAQLEWQICMRMRQV